MGPRPFRRGNTASMYAVKSLFIELQWGLALSGGETAFTPRITSSIVASWCVSRNIGLHLAVHRACTSSLDQNQPLKMRALQAIRYHHRTSRIWSETRGS